MKMRFLFLPVLVITTSFCASAQIKNIAVNPTETDSKIETIHGNHVAYIDTTVKPLNKLLLMIVGTGTAADHNIPFFNFAASMGYHVVSLDYKNNVITTVCSNSEDSACFNFFRQEIIFGQAVSPLVEVDSANSIFNRFYKLLLFLSKKYPTLGWQQYLTGNKIQWQKMTVAGHSQGAGHAAYLGKNFPLGRVLILAGPQDYLVHFNRPAGWLSQKSVTSPSRYFAFLHVKDPYDFSKQLADSRKAMPATADTVLVLPNTAVAKKRQILVVNIEAANPHESMMQPGFEKAWQYLLSTNPLK